MNTQSKVKLTDIQGIARKSGTDQYGCEWVQFEVDFLAEQEEGVCSICGEELVEGWMNLDCGSEEVCTDHVEYKEI